MRKIIQAEGDLGGLHVKSVPICIILAFQLGAVQFGATLNEQNRILGERKSHFFKLCKIHDWSG
jgi:hypothetical protein